MTGVEPCRRCTSFLRLGLAGARGVVDAAGSVLPRQRDRQSRVFGPSATRGYYRNPDATAGAGADGWLVSGIMPISPTAELSFTGRARTLIIRGGRNFCPYDLEHAVGARASAKGVWRFRRCRLALHGGERLVVVAKPASAMRPPTGAGRGSSPLLPG